ncbi:hypothetical protein TspCOW1_11660 [Thiohalobacter sp. COW1]|uniref:hypothetical protein n=1 Tax=Thiohalobacter sp. COW1 TaxID=2795687 RepID=UPI0019167CDB|nr:hypothetical protein [Thiohalobacter sp. COW1]BCO31063.1 hypothetical protein TspCOW1_11660 [Thiohalobacter sp. COW1]
MDDDLAALYEDKDFISIYFTITSLPRVEFGIRGLAGSDKDKYQDEWYITGGVEGTFSFSMDSRVDVPKKWKGCKVSLGVNRLGSDHRAEYEKHGYIGYGSFEEEGVNINLHIKPKLARDILDKLTIFNEEETEHKFRCDIVDLNRRNSNDDAALDFRVVRLYC